MLTKRALSSALDLVGRVESLAPVVAAIDRWVMDAYRVLRADQRPWRWRRAALHASAHDSANGPWRWRVVEERRTRSNEIERDGYMGHPAALTFGSQTGV